MVGLAIDLKLALGDRVALLIHASFRVDATNSHSSCFKEEQVTNIEVMVTILKLDSIFDIVMLIQSGKIHSFCLLLALFVQEGAIHITFS